MVEHHTQLRARHLSRSEEGSEAEVDHGPRGGGRVALTHVNGERTEGAAADERLREARRCVRLEV